MAATQSSLSDVMSSMFERYAAARQKHLWGEEDEQKHPRDDHGRWAHTMSRGEFHQQEKVKPGYDVSATNKTYWAAVKTAALEGKEIHPKADEEHRQIFGEPVSRASAKPKEPTSGEASAGNDVTANPGELKTQTPQATLAAPTLPAASQPTLPGLEPEKPSETPREAATRQQATLDEDYEFARKSAVRNAGEDLKGSARHKRNEWRGLEDAEKNGTAAEMVTRDNLLKAEPHGLMSLADKNPLTALAMHFALRAFPAKPGHGNERQRARVNEETRKKDREQFVTTYREYKAKCEELAESEPNPVKAVEALREFVGAKIFDLRGVPHNIRNDYLGRSGTVGSDVYNSTANSLIDTKTSLLTGRHARKTGVAGRVEDFKEAARDKYQQTAAEIGDEQLADHTKDVIEGRSINETFGKKGDGKSKAGFTAADKYVKHAKRVGGRDVSDVTSDANKAAKHLLDKFGARGVQFGNSVTDDERVHHAARLVESLADLADVTGLKPQDLGLGGKVGWAIGARGHGTASAHYEPGTQVINLTRKSGVGALAHEWGHAFDHSIHGFKIIGTGDKREGDYASNRVSAERFEKDEHGGVKTIKDERGRTRAVTVNMAGDPIWKAFDGVRKAFKSSGFQDRSAAQVRKLNDNEQLSDDKAKYWNSTIERFARSFEVHVQHSLREKGRENTYLSGLAASGEDSLWPTPSEAKAMAPAFEALFAAYRHHKYGTDEVQKYSRQDLIESLAGDMVRYSLRTTIERAAAETNIAPSQQQIEAGNYRKGRFRLWGKEIVIENPRGSTRSGTSRDGKAWSNELPHHYGYISRHEGADGDAIDCYIGRHPESEVVFVVDQHDPTTGHFDEHKCFIGFRSTKEAKQCYLDGFSRGGKAALRFGHIATMTKDQFLEWLDGDETKHPVFGARQVVRYAVGFDPNEPRDRLGRWFSESADADIAKLKSVEINVPEHWKTLPIHELRDVAEKEIQRLRKTKEFANHPGLGRVDFSSRGQRKTINSSNDPAKLFLIADIKKVIESAIHVKSNPPDDPKEESSTKAYHTLVARVKIEHSEYPVIVTVRRDVSGHFHYNHLVFANEKSPLASQAIVSTKGSQSTPAINGLESFVRPPLRPFNTDSKKDDRQSDGGPDKYSHLTAAITRELYAAQRSLFDESEHPRDEVGKFALKDRIHDHLLKVGGPVRHRDILRAMGHTDVDAQNPQANLVNKALKEMRDAGVIEAHQPQWGEPSFSANPKQPQPKESVSGQQQGLFDRGEFTSGQKSLFNVIAPDKPKPKSKTSGGDLFAGLQADLAAHLSKKSTLSPADRGIVVQPEALPGQKEMFARRVLEIVERYDATAHHAIPARPDWLKPKPAVAPQPDQQTQSSKSKPSAGAGAWQKVGGSSVFVNSAGTITKGCPGLKGHAVGELIDESEESRDRREAKQAHAFARGLTGRDLSASAANKFASPRYVAQHQNAKSAAKRSGVATTDVLGAMPGVLEAVSEAFKTREAAKANARKLTGMNEQRINVVENRGQHSTGKNARIQDYTHVPGFDTAAMSFLYEHPELGFGGTEGNTDDASQKVWDLIREGKQTIPQLHHASIADEAANMVAARKRPTRAQQIASVVSAAFEDDSFSFGANVAAF